MAVTKPNGILQRLDLDNVSFSRLGQALSSSSLLDLQSLVALALVASALTIVYRLCLHPLAGVPGPFLAKFSGFWRQQRYWAGTWHDDILLLHKTYGRVVRIAPNELSIVDGNAVKQLYSHGSKSVKTSWYKTWEPSNGRTNVFAVQDKKMHSYLRKRVSSIYSMSSILKYEPYVQVCLSLLMKQLMKHARVGDTIDMAMWTNAFAYDVVGELAYGEEFGHLRTESDVGKVRQTLCEAFFLIANLGHTPGQMGLLDNKLTAKITHLLRIDDPSSRFKQWNKKKVLPRWEGKGPQGRADMLSHFLKMKTENGSPVDFEEVIQESLTIMGAGADTTSIGMRACLYYICKNPDVYARLQREIDEFYAANNLTEPVTYLQTQGMPYLQAVVKEATRLFPSINYQLLRHCPDGGMTIDGRFIPAGTVVGVSPLAQNRDQAIWGKDADEFRPERWLEDLVYARTLEAYNMTFGGNGPRMCIGKNIALVEMHKFVAQLMWTFDFEFVNKDKPWRVTSQWFAFQHDMDLKMTPRPGRETSWDKY
ncbi:cytochrome P450 [Cadophora sp. DSE1049]|nr:cytochrome P450 [Cadophora sp. DSE1049]